MFSYLLANNFIEHNIQKGFTPHISGTFEHTAQMAYIMNQARIRQRSLIIILLDLKNAFGEVHHNLIKSVLGYHHIPNHVQLIIKSRVRIKRGYGYGTERIDGTDMRIKRGADMRIKRGADMRMKRGADLRIKRGVDMRIKRGWVVFLWELSLNLFRLTCYGT